MAIKNKPTKGGKIPKKLTCWMVETVVESIADWVLIIEHKNHKWIYSNPACKRLLGYSPAELVGRTTFNSPVLTPESKEIIKKSWEKLEKEGFLSGIEINLLHKEGRKIPVAYSSGLIKNQKGEITHRVNIIRDISEIKDLVNKLESSRQELERNFSKLQEMNKVMIGRELRIAGLKEEAAQLKEEIEKLKRNHQ